MHPSVNDELLEWPWCTVTMYMLASSNVNHSPCKVSAATPARCTWAWCQGIGQLLELSGVVSKLGKFVQSTLSGSPSCVTDDVETDEDGSVVTSL